MPRKEIRSKATGPQNSHAPAQNKERDKQKAEYRRRKNVESFGRGQKIVESYFPSVIKQVQAKSMLEVGDGN